MYLDLDLFRFILEKIQFSVLRISVLVFISIFAFRIFVNFYSGFWFIYLGFCVN